MTEGTCEKDLMDVIIEKDEKFLEELINQKSFDFKECNNTYDIAKNMKKEQAYTYSILDFT